MIRPSAEISLVRGLGLAATTSILVGDVIGTGVFLKARVMTCNVGSPGLVIAAWVVGGLLSIAGALVYAELSAMMPRAGGEYVFIREAYGRRWGFLYGWMRFFIGSTAGIAALATGFAIFLNVLADGALDAASLTVHVLGRDLTLGGVQIVALAALAVVTAINCAAVAVSGSVATALTVLKAALVLAVGLAALLLARGSWTNLGLAAGSAVACEGVSEAARGGVAGFGAAMIGALWAYNGWNEVTYVAGEVRHPERNLPIALMLGIGIVTVLYVFVNAAYFYVLTPAEIASVPASSSVAAAAVARVLGPAATTLMATAMALSVFGALHVATLVTARIPYAMARDGLLFQGLGRLSTRTHVPVRALVAQSVWSAVLVLSGSFDVLTDYAMFGILIFVGLATASVFVFRRRMPAAERPYRTWGYPVVPLLFLGVAGWLVLNAVVTTPRQAVAGLGLIIAGLPFYAYWSRQRRAAVEERRLEAAGD